MPMPMSASSQSALAHFGRRMPWFRLASVVLISGLSACGGGGGGSDSAATQSVSLEFVATLGDTPVNCASTLTGLGTAAGNARLQDLRLYVSNLKLINDKDVAVSVKLDANDFQLTSGSDTVALVDLEDASGLCAGDSTVHATITGTVPKGSYEGVQMTLGVPESLNHSETSVAAAPLNNVDMGWGWQAGRKFAKIEVNPENPSVPGTYTNGVAKYDEGGVLTGTTNSSFFFHLGNTGCAPVAGAAAGTYTCASDNTRTFHIHGFNYQTQRITVDLKALFALSTLTEEHGGAAGCMSSPTDPECIAMWSVIGSSFNADGISVQDPANEFFHGETVFRALAKAP